MGRVDCANSSTSDHVEIEKDRQVLVQHILFIDAAVNWKDSKINTTDTPGSDDFIGESISSMKVADTACSCFAGMLNMCGKSALNSFKYVEAFPFTDRDRY
ncbi:MAG: hypothetical protein IPL69_19220 [Saprospiraceae bacterium]|nr:hypothetical protein [Candidatus Brachybacter algidus]